MKTKQQLVDLGLDEIKADEVMLLESEMLKRAVKFQFRKKDDSVRDAVGTLRRDLMKQEDGTIWEPTGEGKPEPASIMRFFDVVAGAWRCFTVTQFIAMEA